MAMPTTMDAAAAVNVDMAEAGRLKADGFETFKVSNMSGHYSVKSKEEFIDIIMKSMGA